MILITSAAYISREFQNEVGPLPPSFLPVGNKRLISHQVHSLGKSFPEEDIYLTVPNDYLLSDHDQFLIKKLNVHLVYIPMGLSLCQSILYGLNYIGIYDASLRILHGDTLIENIPENLDIISIANTYDDYEWEVENIGNEQGELVWCGYFSISNIRLFIKCLASSQEDFSKAVREYKKNTTLKNVISYTWHDYGHINTYFKSRAQFTTQRSFNALEVDKGVLKKKGMPESKIFAESYWYAEVPHMVKKYTPNYLGAGRDKENKYYYCLEYLPYLPLNELFVYCSNPTYFWSNVFNLCSDFLENCHKVECSELDEIMKKEHKELIEGKTLKRLDALSKAHSFDLNEECSYNNVSLPSVKEIANICIEKSLELPAIYGVMHGDFCFSNILYDTRSEIIKVIDPRAMNSKNEPSLYGNLVYDIAKLSHSVLGYYDLIVAGCFSIKQNNMKFQLNIFHDERIKEIGDTFLHKRFLGINPIDTIPIVVLLFISMLPLHADNKDRQSALMANALRLYSEYLSNTR